MIRRRQNPTRKRSVQFCDFSGQCAVMHVSAIVDILPGNRGAYFRADSCWVFIANTFFSSHQQSVLQGTTFRPGVPSHFQVSKKKKDWHFLFLLLTWKWLGQPGRNVMLCNTDCWCDEKKVLGELIFGGMYFGGIAADSKFLKKWRVLIYGVLRYSSCTFLTRIQDMKTFERNEQWTF